MIEVSDIFSFEIFMGILDVKSRERIMRIDQCQFI